MPCEQKQAIDGIKGELADGRVEFAKLHDSQSRMEIMLENINRRLFVDNGTKSVQTRINKMETLSRVLIWLAGVLTVATVGLISRLVFEWVR